MTPLQPLIPRIPLQPLVPRAIFLRHFASNSVFAIGVIFGSLFLGALGYHAIGRLGWIDAFLNASMILTGMGPVDHMSTAAAKIFATVYALFSGVVFLTSVGVFMAPLVHRFLHQFHLDIEDSRPA
jgi:hypothetical protein